MENENLIYNSNFKNGSDGWSLRAEVIYDSTDKINGSQGCLVCTGSVTAVLSDFIPVKYNDTYKLDLDIKGVTITGSNYICLMCYDANKTLINVQDINITTTSYTTLAQQLVNGDTKVYLTSVTGWDNSNGYGNVGIIDSPAYERDRAIYYQAYAQGAADTTNKCVTLSSAWAGGTWAAGTPVAKCLSGSVYVYPIFGTFPTTWTHYTGSTTLRHATKFVKLGVLVQRTDSIKIANPTLINTSQHQVCERFSSSTQPELSKAGIVKTNLVKQGAIQARYIRDWLKGNTTNNNNHWCEIQAYDTNGFNVAYASDGAVYVNGTASTPVETGRSPNNISNANFPFCHFITNNSSAYSPYLSISGGNGKLCYVQLDLGAVFDLTQLKIWHYWSNGRTYYNTKTEVSADGTNWITVFDSAIEGTYPETSAGHTINLNKSNVSLVKQGKLLANEIYEV